MFKSETKKPIQHINRKIQSNFFSGHSVPDTSFFKSNSNKKVQVNQLLQAYSTFFSGEVPQCGEKSYGESDCDFVDGVPTGKAWYNVTDTDPCSRPCTEEHEKSHVKDLEPVCSEYKGCYDQHENNIDKRLECENRVADKLVEMHKYSECKAYDVSIKCLNEQLKNPECQSPERQKALRKKIVEEQCYRRFYCWQSVKEIFRKIWNFLKEHFGSLFQSYNKKKKAASQ